MLSVICMWKITVAFQIYFPKDNTFYNVLFQILIAPLTSVTDLG